MSLLGLIVAAPRSGAGKTTVTLGLIRALSRRGMRVQPFKCGPDYIDPAFHAAAAGRPGCNLDSWAMPAPLIARLIAEHGAGAELAIAEGVMGLFDGAAGEGLAGHGATADIAALTGWPVVLVLDVAGQTETAAAVALGCARYRRDVTVAGVILNRVASARHLGLIAPAFACIGMPVLGALHREPHLTLPERHLGLVQAGEHPDLAAHLDRLAEAVARSVDLDAVVAASRQARSAAAGDGFAERGSTPLEPHPGLAQAGGPSGFAAHLDRFAEAIPRPVDLDAVSLAARKARLLTASADDAARARTQPPPLPPPGQRIALAQDRAFSFTYPHIVQGWRAAGAEILPFSPLADEAPDARADAVWLPGGYPELHAGTLAAATAFREGLRRLAGRGAAIHGECGGYMVLGEGLEDADGARYAMAGLLAVETSFARRRLTLGYRRARLLATCALGGAGGEVLGHEFHYAAVLASGDAPLVACTDAAGARIGEQGSRRGAVSGTFFHAITAYGALR